MSYQAFHCGLGSLEVGHMFSVSQLTDDQTAQIKDWAAAGAQLADIQKKMNEELGVKITYMDTRFAVADLGIQLVTEVAKLEPKLEPVVKIPTGRVEATVDEIVRVGALRSGSVSFSDGEKALWMIDQQGRLSIEADTPGYDPDEENIIQFQEQLRDLLKA